MTQRSSSPEKRSRWGGTRARGEEQRHGEGSCASSSGDGKKEARLWWTRKSNNKDQDRRRETGSPWGRSRGLLRSLRVCVCVREYTLCAVIRKATARQRKLQTRGTCRSEQTSGTAEKRENDGSWRKRSLPRPTQSGDASFTSGNNDDTIIFIYSPIYAFFCWVRLLFNLACVASLWPLSAGWWIFHPIPPQP